MNWVLERGAFSDHDEALADAARRAGHDVVDWDDAWWQEGRVPILTGPVVFHGSLGNAVRIREQLSWRPGAFADAAAFACSVWLPEARAFALNVEPVFTTVRELVTHPQTVLAPLGAVDAVFVRPDSALKPFAGRVVRVADLSPEALEHGFYYNDLDLPVMADRVRTVDAELRAVVVNREVVAHGGYVAEGRRSAQAPQALLDTVQDIARRMDPPEAVYVVDVAQTPTGPRLVEVNPFSGSDFYGLDRDAIVAAVSDVCGR